MNISIENFFKIDHGGGFFQHFIFDCRVACTRTKSPVHLTIKSFLYLFIFLRLSFNDVCDRLMKFIDWVQCRHFGWASPKMSPFCWDNLSPYLVKLMVIPHPTSPGFVMPVSVPIPSLNHWISLLKQLNMPHMK